MAATIGSVLGDIEAFLYSLGHFRDRVATLTAPVGESGTSLTVDDGTQVSKGLVEIDDELIYVQVADSTGTAVIPPWGRAQVGTTAGSHATGSRVRIHPAFPRSVIKRELQTAISQLYPDLWSNVVDTTSILTTLGDYTYTLPAAVESIVHLDVQPASTNYPWVPITRYRFDPGASTADFPSGKSLSFFQYLQADQVLKVTYRAKFTPFTSESDTLASLGMSDRWVDILRDTVGARLILSLEAAKLAQAGTATTRGDVTPFHAVNLSKHLTGLVTARTNEERRKLLNDYQARVVRHY